MSRWKTLVICTFASIIALITMLTLQELGNVPQKAVAEEPITRPITCLPDCTCREPQEPIGTVPSTQSAEVIAETLWLTEQIQIDLLFHSVCWNGERSNGNQNEYHEAEDAAGVAQITPINIIDTNRILALQSSDKRYTMADRWSPSKSREIFEIYCRHWAGVYADEIAELGMSWQEVWARTWNGGNRGWQKTSTLEYWERVQKGLDQ